MIATLPDFSLEQFYWSKKHSVIGIDEVGRGAFAGPVGVGGVVFDWTLSKKQQQYLLSLGINDSKKLSQKKREELAKILIDFGVLYHTEFIDVATINEVGIGKATYLGMECVAASLSKKTSNPVLLIDAFEIPNYKFLQKGIVRGDTLSISIAAASIIAKVARDELMQKLSQSHPEYGFERHKGYGTEFHRQNIVKYGISEHHRKDFCHAA